MQNFMKTILNAIKTWTKVEIQQSKEETKEELNSRIKNSAADWNQNDPSADSYVKNRPFYEDNGVIHKLDSKYLPITRLSDLENDLYYNNTKSVLRLENSQFSYDNWETHSIIVDKPSEITDLLLTKMYVSYIKDGVNIVEECTCDEQSGNSYYFYVGNKSSIKVTDGQAPDGNSINGLYISYLWRYGEDEGEDGQFQALDWYVIDEKRIDRQFLDESVLDDLNKVQAAVDNAQATADSKMDASNPIGIGSFSMNRKADTAVGDYSHAEGYNTTAVGDYSHAEGYNTTAVGDYSHIEGKYNKYDYTLQSNGIEEVTFGLNNLTYSSESIIFDSNTGKITMDSPRLISFQPAVGEVNRYFSGRFDGFDNLTSITYVVECIRYKNGDVHCNAIKYTAVEKEYAHIVGNGTSDDSRSNAHTLDWDGNAWYAGDVYVGSSSGTNIDEDSKKLATEELVAQKSQVQIITWEADD